MSDQSELELPVNDDGRVMSHADYIKPFPTEIPDALDSIFGPTKEASGGPLTCNIVLTRHFSADSNTDPSSATGTDAMLDTQYGRPAARAAGEVVYNNIRFNPESVPVLILASPLNRSYESQAHLRQGVQLALSHIGTGDDVPPILVLDLLRESAESAGSKLAKREFDDPRLHIQGYATFRGEAVWTALTQHHSEGISGWEEPMAARGKYIREAISELARGIQARTENDTITLWVGSHAHTIKAISKAYWPHQSPISLHNGQTARIVVQMGKNGLESAEISVDPHSDLAIYHTPCDRYTEALKAGLDNGSVDDMSSMCSTLPDQ